MPLCFCSLKHPWKTSHMKLIQLHPVPGYLRKAVIFPVKITTVYPAGYFVAIITSCFIIPFFSAENSCGIGIYAPFPLILNNMHTHSRKSHEVSQSKVSLSNTRQVYQSHRQYFPIYQVNNAAFILFSAAKVNTALSPQYKHLF